DARPARPVGQPALCLVAEPVPGGSSQGDGAGRGDRRDRVRGHDGGVRALVLNRESAFEIGGHDHMHTGSTAGRPLLRRALLAIAVLALATGLARTARAEGGAAFDPSVRADFREPVTLASTGGVLEVRLTARQGEAVLDTVATPVRNFLLFDYELIRGTA